jgi:hypothetical protein
LDAKEFGPVSTSLRLRLQIGDEFAKRRKKLTPKDISNALNPKRYYGPTDLRLPNG